MIIFSFPQKYKPFLLPVLTLVIIVILSLTLGKFLLGKVFETRTQISELQEKNKSLEAKEQLLSRSGSEGLKQQVSAAVAAIPSENSSLFLLSTIRALTNESGLQISDFGIREDQDVKQGSRLVQARLDLQGSIFSALSFLGAIQNSAPLVKVTSLNFTLSGVNILAKVTVVSSWSPLPSELSRVDSPIEGLSNPEQELLGKLSQLRMPRITEVLTSQPAGKPDPFAF